MQKLTNYEKKDYAVLLANEKLDASKGVLFNVQGLPPSTNRCTILIGLGGQGVQTLDYVKGELTKRMDPSWEDYVDFLGIDASWSEFQHARYLEKDECIMITDAAVANRMQNPATYPAATRRFMLDNAKLGALSSDGSGRTRLVGKVKLHDQAPGSPGFDEKIVQKLTEICGKHAGYLPSDYNVFVFGSVCGGTCSGTFLEMPALIRKQLPDADIHAMLYLPDTLAPLDPGHKAQLFANGYASLKELNYYMGMYMRPGYSETWTYGNPASPTLTYQSSAVAEGFINVPYLIGAPGGAGSHTIKEARVTIAEFIISMLAPMTATNGIPFDATAFTSNANAPAEVGKKLTNPANPAEEHSGEYHEFPKRFATLGYAAATVPHKTVRAYTVSKACELAGLKPVSVQERRILASAGDGVLLPFKSSDDYETATTGTGKAQKVLQPLATVMGYINNGSFSFEADLNQQDVTWRKIKNGTYDNATIQAAKNTIVGNRTSANEMNKMQAKIRELFSAYRKNVHEFVKEEGPFAFYNLFEGRFTPVGTDQGAGIREMIQNLVDGKRMHDGLLLALPTAQQAEEALQQTRNVINETSPVAVLKHSTQASGWVSKYNAWCAASINEVRRKAALGTHGYLYKDFLFPAIALAEEVLSFGHILSAMTDTYTGHGSKMKSFGAFKEATDRECEVNIASVNVNAYTWIKEKADSDTAVINAKALRDNIVDHFFGVDTAGIPNTSLWLNFEDYFVKQTPAGVQLTNAEAAVPARAIFDKLLSENYTDTLQVTIQSMFDELKNRGTSYQDTANAIVGMLARKSTPMFNGTLPESAFHRYIVYPSSLRAAGGSGADIANAIEHAAKTEYEGINVISNQNATSIMLFQQATPLEIYRLKDLADWEKEYENGGFGIRNTNAFLHGKSPDITEISAPGEATQYIEGMRWIDYPSIVPTKDPRKKDPATGQISREGQLRLKLDGLIQEARELGVLSSRNTVGRWSVYRVHCDRATDWQFALEQCAPDPATGLLPLGMGLAEEIAKQNRKTLADMSAPVLLDLAGLMSGEHPTEELAWEFAARVLRFHVPMYAEVRETVKKFADWSEDIKKYNQSLQRNFLPAMMVNMLRAQILIQDAAGVWKFVQADGSHQVIANLAPAFLPFLPAIDRAMIQNGMFSYFLFNKLDAALHRDIQVFQNANARAKEQLAAWVAMSDLASLNEGQKHMELVLKEADDLAAKGAQLDGMADKPVSSVFTRAMAAIPGANLSPDKLKDIELFYYRAKLVDMI